MKKKKDIVCIRIDCVDGETRLTFEENRKAALEWLSKNDHEGSSLCLEENGDHCYSDKAVYGFLRRQQVSPFMRTRNGW